MFKIQTSPPHFQRPLFLKGVVKMVMMLSNTFINEPIHHWKGWPLTPNWNLLCSVLLQAPAHACISTVVVLCAFSSLLETRKSRSTSLSLPTATSLKPASSPHPARSSKSLQSELDFRQRSIKNHGDCVYHAMKWSAIKWRKSTVI